MNCLWYFQLLFLCLLCRRLSSLLSSAKLAVYLFWEQLDLPEREREKKWIGSYDSIFFVWGITPPLLLLLLLLLLLFLMKATEPHTLSFPMKNSPLRFVFFCFFFFVQQITTFDNTKIWRESRERRRRNVRATTMKKQERKKRFP